MVRIFNSIITVEKRLPDSAGRGLTVLLLEHYVKSLAIKKIGVEKFNVFNVFSPPLTSEW